MPKRTTVILDDDIYERLVQESVKRYGNVRSLSKVINDLLRKSLSSEDELIKLIYSEKLVEIDLGEFEEFRRELSKRFEDR
ncbi:MAG: hypothetical protein ACP5GI_06585 [Sulfolobales archaeon]